VRAAAANGLATQLYHACWTLTSIFAPRCSRTDVLERQLVAEPGRSPREGANKFGLRRRVCLAVIMVLRSETDLQALVTRGSVRISAQAIAEGKSVAPDPCAVDDAPRVTIVVAFIEPEPGRR
jgi:hypothetical protein